VAIAGTLGLLPLWVTTAIEIHKERSVKWLLSKFSSDKKERAKIKVDDVISNVTAALKTRVDANFSRRTFENILCKIFRRHTKNNSDGLFHDILVPGQNLYSVNMQTIQVMAANGETVHTTKQPLLSLVPFHRAYISLKDLHGQLPTNWQGWEPIISGLGNKFMKGLFDSRRGSRPESLIELNPSVICFLNLCIIGT
jgi:hypothetical protein